VANLKHRGRLPFSADRKKLAFVSNRNSKERYELNIFVAEDWK
jgi:hypothetical protein